MILHCIHPGLDAELYAVIVEGGGDCRVFSLFLGSLRHLGADGGVNGKRVCEQGRGITGFQELALI